MPMTANLHVEHDTPVTHSTGRGTGWLDIGELFAGQVTIFLPAVEADAVAFLDRLAEAVADQRHKILSEQ